MQIRLVIVEMVKLCLIKKFTGIMILMNCTRKSGQWKFKLFNIKKEVQKMAKRQIQFTQEQIEILLKNPNVESISW